ANIRSTGGVLAGWSGVIELINQTANSSCSGVCIVDCRDYDDYDNLQSQRIILPVLASLMGMPRIPVDFLTRSRVR
ncbi:hypothetical protein LCGC14_0922910, partial [marine sediment metagenome]